jgi:glycosyltransferase involved in cell wall biosynthesis
MRVLWFSHITLNPNEEGKFFYPGGNWITSLKDLIDNDPNIELGITFYGDKEGLYEDTDGTKYYQLLKKHNSKLKNYYNNWRRDIGSDTQLKKLADTIHDFKPDVIHIFGTESIFGKIVNYTSVPIVIHLQGLINPCLNAWQFPGFKINSLLLRSNFLFLIKGVGLFHDFFRYKKIARRELEIFRLGKHFMGRTHWDKAVTKLYAPQSTYYHCDEVIRDCFYQVEWEMPKGKKIILATTVNANMYKGLDLILKTARLLKHFSTIDFEWRVYGVRSDSEYARFIEATIKDKFSSNNIVLKGTTLTDDLLKGLLESNLFVHSSYIDNSSNSICEAQMIGLPVISTNVGGVSTLIHDEVDGYLVPSNEPEMLAYKIIDLAANPEKLQAVSKKSIEVARKRHDRTTIKNSLLGIYSSIANKNNPQTFTNNESGHKQNGMV